MSDERRRENEEALGIETFEVLPWMEEVMTVAQC